MIVGDVIIENTIQRQGDVRVATEHELEGKAALASACENGRGKSGISWVKCRCARPGGVHHCPCKMCIEQMT